MENREKIKLSVSESIFKIDSNEWDACSPDQPFLKHAFFQALEYSKAVGPKCHIAPQYIQLRDQADKLMACAPAMLKTGTLAEYGPEYRWLQAGKEAKCFSWPKFQVGLPLYPIHGQKLLVRPDLPEEKFNSTLINALKFLSLERYKVAALNIMHIDKPLALDLFNQGWLISQEIHSIWHNENFNSFESYLESLPHRKRYIINKERRKTKQLGLDIKILSGQEISPSLLVDYYSGHTKVCHRYGNRPWLPLSMFHYLIKLMPHAIKLIAAFHGDRYIAGAFCIVDSETLFVRTWSAMEELPELCFELICYRPVMFAIENGLKQINSGLTGMHKKQRGYNEEPVFSAHWFNNDQLRELARKELSNHTDTPSLSATTRIN